MSSKYEKYRTSIKSVPIVPESATELEKFDWFGFQSTAPKEVHMPEHVSIINAGAETPEQRKLRMLRQLSLTCTACSMCELGLQGAIRNDEIRDPHVFSNMNPVRFMVVGQNPGWDELKRREPFVGAAGKNFDTEIKKHGLDRTHFYICNTVRCHTKDNIKPTQRHMDKCEPFLRMEIGLLKPRLVITLGAVAFAQLCPDLEYGKSLKSIVQSSKFGVPVFAVYHPSPMNFREEHRKKAFEKQIQLLCSVIKRLQ